MKKIIRSAIQWLTQDEQHTLFEFLFAFGLMLAFLLVSGLLLWLLGQLSLALLLVKYYALFWVLLFGVSAVLIALQGVFRIDPDEQFRLFLISTAIASGALQLTWSVMIAIAFRAVAIAVPIWQWLPLYGVGIVSCYVTFVIVSAQYPGQFYRVVNLLLGLISFVVFSIGFIVTHWSSSPWLG